LCYYLGLDPRCLFFSCTRLHILYLLLTRALTSTVLHSYKLIKHVKRKKKIKKITGNEIADSLAKEATKLDPLEEETSFVVLGLKIKALDS